MNHRSILPHATAILALAFGSWLAAPAAGQLDPPSGPIAPTMKRLDQIESRTVLSSLPGAGNAVCVVSQPGRYFLTADMPCPQGKHCILITTPGDVTIDLNGYSLRGSAGSLDGIHADGGGGGGGGALRVTGCCSGGNGGGGSGGAIQGFSRGIAIGDVNGDGYPDVVVAGLTISNCGQGLVHLHAQKIIHRDLACRNILVGDGVHVEFDAPSNSGAGPRQTTSLDSSFCKVDGCAARGMCVVCPPSGELSVRMQHAAVAGCGGHGVCMEGAAATSTVVSLDMQECRVSSSGGRAVSVQGSGGGGGAVGTARIHMTFRKIEMDGCALGGLYADHADLLDCWDSTIADCGGDGVSTAGVSRVSVRDLSVLRCAGHGIHTEDCDDGNFIRVAAGDVTGDGFRCKHIGGVKYEDITITRPHGDGIHHEDCDDGNFIRVSASDVTGDGIVSVVSLGSNPVERIDIQGSSFTRCHGRAVAVSDCKSVSCVRVAVGDVDGDGFAFARCGTTTCKADKVVGAVLDSVSFTDCDDTDCDDVSVSRCARGLTFSWTQVGGPLASMRCSDVDVQRCSGAGLSLFLPDGKPCRATMSRCSSSGNGGEGMVVTCATATCDLQMTMGKVKFFNDAKGFSLVAHPQASVSLDVKECDFSSNTGHGLEVVSSDAATSLRGGGAMYCWGSNFSRNGGSGVVTESPLYMESSTCSENVLYGVRCTAPDPLTLACQMSDCVMKSNGASCGSCSRGRFATERCQVSDGLSHGLECEDGCLLLMDTQVQKCAGDGVRAHGTLTIQGGALRRNGFAGARCGDGSCVATGCSVELNGSLAPPGASPECGLVFLNCSSVSLTRCSLTSNSGEGAFCSSTTGLTRWSSLDCVVQNNTRDGLHLSDCDDGDVSRCTVSGNGGAGLWCTGTFSHGRIKDCSCKGNLGGGIKVEGLGNLVVSNSATIGSAAIPAIFIAPGNGAGEIIDSSQVPTRCNTNDNVVY